MIEHVQHCQHRAHWRTPALGPVDHPNIRNTVSPVGTNDAKTNVSGMQPKVSSAKTCNFHLATHLL